MILFFLYIFFLVLENLLLPAIAGPGLFLITPVFLLAVIIHTSNFKKAIVQLITFGLVGELFMGSRVGSSLMPLVTTAFVYFIINHFIEMKAGLDGVASSKVILGRSFILTGLSYIYFWFFIFFNSFREFSSFDELGLGNFAMNDIYTSWDIWNIFLSLGSIVIIFIWSCIFSIILGHVFKTK